MFWAEPANIRIFANRPTVTSTCWGGRVPSARPCARHRGPHCPSLANAHCFLGASGYQKICALKESTYVYFGQLHELHLPNKDDHRFMQWATARSTRPKRAHDTRTITRLSRDHLLDMIARQHHYNTTICMEMRRDLMHERCLRPRKLYDSRPR